MTALGKKAQIAALKDSHVFWTSHLPFCQSLIEPHIEPTL